MTSPFNLTFFIITTASVSNILGVNSTVSEGVVHLIWDIESNDMRRLMPIKKNMNEFEE